MKTALPMALAAALVLVYAPFFVPTYGIHVDDHLEYVGLAHGLVERGEYTRAAVGEPFAPEPLRLPGYPLFLAAICATVGCDAWRVAIVQAVLFALMIPLVGWIARRIDARLATPTMWLTALYLPFAYYAARPLSDFLSALLLVTAVAAFVVATERRSIGWGAAFGATCAWLALTRPVFLPIPVAFAVAGLLTDRAAFARAWRPWLASVVASAALIAPVAAYQLGYFGAPSTGSSGTLLWLGYVQARQVPGDTVERYERAIKSDAPEEEIARFGPGLGLDREETLVSADVKRHVWAFEAITDRRTQAYAFVELDRYLRTQALRLIADHPIDWIGRGLTIRTVELWAGDDPFFVPNAPPAPIELGVARMTVRLVLSIFALIGIVQAIRARRSAFYLPAVLLAYVWITAFPFWTEGRYSLPVMPFAFMSAASAVTALVARRGSRPPAEARVGSRLDL